MMARPTAKPAMTRAPRKDHPYEPNPPQSSEGPVTTRLPRAEQAFRTFSSRVDPVLVRQFKVTATLAGTTVQAALAEAMREWVDRHMS